ncbi:MAG: hypothetical protein ACRCWO_04945 [Bosea sp. (in: a-proteobacteria)]
MLVADYADAIPENDERRFLHDRSISGAGHAWRCMLQHHVNTRLTASNDSPPRPPSYHLHYAEFLPSVDGVDIAQARALKAHLAAQKSAGRDNYVIFFVHGWRNDAGFANANARSFRVLLSYAASYVEQRRQENGTAREIAVTGVYVGWRGRRFDETWAHCLVAPFHWRMDLERVRRCAPPPDASLAAAAVSILHAPSFLWAKSESERAAAGVIAFLNSVEEQLQLRHETRGDKRDRMLVVGHSLGGNLLLSGLAGKWTTNSSRPPPVQNSLKAHHAALESSPASPPRLRPPMGDLVVLLNPASEARKWSKIQQLENQTALSAQGPAFGLTQKPVLMAMTSACNWPKEDKERLGRANECDTVTHMVFRAAQISRMNLTRSGNMALGHHDVDLHRSNSGTSHEFDVNQSLQKPTNYANARDANSAQCAQGTGWLSSARWIATQEAKDDARTGPAYWDTSLRNKDTGTLDNMIILSRQRLGDKSPPELTLVNTKVTLAKGSAVADAQFRLGTYEGMRPSPTHAYSPFWNVRADDAAISNHGGFVSHNLWCSLNQIVLDDIVADKLPAYVQPWLREKAAKARDLAGRP